jgi:hypothetical protein
LLKQFPKESLGRFIAKLLRWMNDDEALWS